MFNYDKVLNAQEKFTTGLCMTIFKLWNQFLVINHLSQTHEGNFLDKLNNSLLATSFIFSKEKIKNKISRPVIKNRKELRKLE